LRAPGGGALDMVARVTDTITTTGT
jgi:hypothetical protein